MISNPEAGLQVWIKYQSIPHIGLPANVDANGAKTSVKCSLLVLRSMNNLQVKYDSEYCKL